MLPPAWSRGRSHAFCFSGAIASPGQSLRIPGPSQRRNGVPSSAQANPNTSPADLAPWPPLRRWWRLLLFPALLLANLALIQLVTPGHPQRIEVSYTFFKQQVEADNVAQISTRADTIQGTFRQSVAYQPDPAVAAKTVADFSTVIPAFADPGLESLLWLLGLTRHSQWSPARAR